MAGESKYGQMAQSMKDTGQMIRLMEKDGSSMLMETSTKAIGMMTKLMELESTHTWTVLSIMGSGKMISKVGRE
jgi:hypothetical protein